jgi:hypothetical protein
MSTRTVGTPISLPDDPRKIEFVRNLMAKTKEGKVAWLKKGNALTTAIPDGITINFVVGTSAFGIAAGWELFTVRDKAGNELIQVKAPDFLSAIAKARSVSEAMRGPSPLLEATNQLFAVVSGGISGDELERAIESLKKL